MQKIILLRNLIGKKVFIHTGATYTISKPFPTAPTCDMYFIITEVQHDLIKADMYFEGKKSSTSYYDIPLIGQISSDII